MSLTLFWALWSFIIEATGVDSASYEWFAGLGNLISIVERLLSLFGDSVGLIVMMGRIFFAASAATLLHGYTYRIIFLSTIF